MKKLLFLLLLFIPCFIFSEETFEPYVGEVNNKNGAYLYYYDEAIDDYVASPNSLEYKTKVYVYDEEDKFVVTESFTDYLLKADIDKTDITYEDYKKEFDIDDIVPILDKKEEKTNNNTHNYLYLCIIIAFLLIVTIICVKKKGSKVND